MKLRPSGLHVFQKCTASITLPSVEEPKTEDMAKGTERHRKLAQIPALAMEALVMAGFDARETEIIGTEHKVSLDVMGGTVDVLARTGPRGDAIVLDWKGPWDDTDPTDQVTAYAFGSALTDVTWIVVARVDDDLNLLAVERRELSREYLDEWGKKLHARLREPPTYTIGDHCGRCTSFRFCTAQVGLVDALVRLEPATGLTRDLAGAAWEKLQAYKSALAVIEETLRSMAAQGPIPLPSGGTLQEVEVAKESIDAEKAVKLLPDLPVKLSIAKGDVSQEQLVALRLGGATRTRFEKQVRKVR